MRQPASFFFTPGGIWSLFTERGSLRGQLLRGVIGNAGVNGLSMLTRLVASVALARSIGPDGLGAYSFALAVVGLLAIPVQLGFPQFVLRYCAIYLQRGDTELMKGMIYRVGQIVLGMAALVIVISVAVVEHPFWTRDVAVSATLLWALVLLPWNALCSVGSSALRGLGCVTLAQFTGQVLRPVSFLLILGACLLAGLHLSPTTAVKYNIVASVVTCGAIIWLLVRALPTGFFAASPEFELGQWLRGALPFAILASANVLMQRIDLIMLGVLTTAKDVGVYSVASRISGLVPVGLMIVNSVVGPRIAQLHDSGDLVSLQRLVTHTARAGMAAALPIAVFLWLGGAWVLGAVYGAGFVYGNHAMAILLMGQLFNVAMGSVGLILGMTGNAWYVSFGLGVAAGVNAALNALLIPRYGIDGAAAATSVSVCVWNIVLVVGVFRRLGLVSTAVHWRR